MIINYRQLLPPQLQCVSNNWKGSTKAAIAFIAGTCIGMAGHAIASQNVEERNKDDLLPYSTKFDHWKTMWEQRCAVALQSGSDHNGAFKHSTPEIHRILGMIRRGSALKPLFVSDVTKKDLFEIIDKLHKRRNQIEVLILNAHGSELSMDFQSKDHALIECHLAPIVLSTILLTNCETALLFLLCCCAKHLLSSLSTFPPQEEQKKMFKKLAPGATVILKSCSTGKDFGPFSSIAKTISTYRPDITIIAPKKDTNEFDIDFSTGTAKLILTSRDATGTRMQEDITVYFRDGKQIHSYTLPFCSSFIAQKKEFDEFVLNYKPSFYEPIVARIKWKSKALLRQITSFSPFGKATPQNSQ